MGRLTTTFMTVGSDPLGLLDGCPNTRWCQWHLEVADAEWGQGVHNRVVNGNWRRDGPGLPYTLSAERVDRRGRYRKTRSGT